MTGEIYAERLVANIKTSLELRSHIPYLDMLKELAEGGMPVSTKTLNTSSNFGSFDKALGEVMNILHDFNPLFRAATSPFPLPLTGILDNLNQNIKLLAGIIQDHSEVILTRLDTINAASV